MNTETAAHSVAELTSADFDATLRDGVTLVDFWAPWCGPCRMQVPVLEQVASRLGPRARVAKVNVDQYPELAGRFQITGIPTLLLFKEGPSRPPPHRRTDAPATPHSVMCFDGWMGCANAVS